VVVVSLFLPVLITRDASGGLDVAWDYENLLSLEAPLRVTRVGVARVPGDATEDEKAALAARLRRAPWCSIAIFLEEETFRLFYHSFCKGILWPVFHDSLESAPRGRVTTKDEQAWHAYKRVNQIFRDYVVEAYNEGDLVWIHGFQLALLPAFVSRRLTVAKVGIFLHTPFPSSEIFRTLSMRSELLRGILSADQIGFHLYEYARHFMTNCRRLLGTKYEFDARGAVLDVDGRDVVISCVHAGVEPTVLSRVSASPEGARAFENLRASLPATSPRGTAVTRVIAGIDKIERLRGLPLKLLAYERFLEGAAARRAAGDFAEDEGAGGDRTCLVQYALTSFERQADCDKIRRDCRVLVERIKAKHGNDVLYWHEFFEVPIHDRLALLAVADVFWVSSVRDGLNRWPLEYVAMHGAFAQSHAARRGRCAGRRVGALLLSDNASATRVLLGAVAVNPWGVEDCAAALRNVLAMRPRERLARHAKDAEFLLRSTTAKWAYRVLQDLKAIAKDENRMHATHAGLGLGFRILGMRSGFDALAVDRVARAYRGACQNECAGGSRLIVLDYGGTLVPDAAADRSPKPARDVVVVLDALCRDPRNVVFVVSGRERVDLLDGLCGRDENANLGLAAEHGFFAELVREEDWDLAVPAHARHADDWRAPTLALMDMFAQRTQGTYVETHESCLVWQYRDADPDYGEMQAAELEAQLRVVLTPFASQVSVLRGENPSRGGYVEARPAGMDKGALLQRVLRALDAAGRPADFALVVGDDASDEPMFDALHRWLAPAGQAPARFKGRAFSVCMGKKPSGAESYVDTHDNLVELLQALARVSNRGARYYSSHDFSEQYAPPPAPARPPPVAEGEPDSPPTPAENAPGAAFGRSLSMPAFAAVNAPPRPRRAPKSKVPSWVSFQDAFKLPGVAAPGEAPIPEDSNDENQEEDDAAMFF
ncbi:hypothetical protein AURANDRAFT_29889, partial [Aureococcus anophagefferens]